MADRPSVRSIRRSRRLVNRREINPPLFTPRTIVDLKRLDFARFDVCSGRCSCRKDRGGTACDDSRSKKKKKRNHHRGDLNEFLFPFFLSSSTNRVPQADRVKIARYKCRSRFVRYRPPPGSLATATILFESSDLALYKHPVARFISNRYSNTARAALNFDSRWNVSLSELCYSFAAIPRHGRE